jgi:hypothetical protein
MGMMMDTGVELARSHPSFGYPEHSNWQRVFWQCSNFTGFTHPTKQSKLSNKQTSKHVIKHWAQHR